VTKIILVIVTNLVAPEAAAKHELLFNELNSENGVLKERLCLAAASGVT